MVYTVQYGLILHHQMICPVTDCTEFDTQDPHQYLNHRKQKHFVLFGILCFLSEIRESETVKCFHCL